MSFDTLIAKTRQTLADDDARAHVVLSAQGTLVGVTEVDIRTGAHSFKADEPRSLGGGGVAANPMQYALASLGSCQAITYRIWAAHLGVTLDWSRCGSKATWTCAAATASTTGHGRASPRSASM